jgi:hypothetical protein
MEKTEATPTTTSADGPLSSEDGSLQIDYAAEKKLVRKLDVSYFPVRRAQSNSQ